MDEKMLISGNEYVERLSSYEREVFVKGEKVEDFVNHPNIVSVINSIAYTYELAKKVDAYSPHSDLVNENVNRLNFVNRTPEDLIARYDYQRELSMRLGTCNYRCTGADAIASLYPATKELDERLGTDYHDRFLKLLREIQKKDYACTAALTDVKGDRAKRPKEARDMYVHVVERKEDGIVVSGAKIHQSGAFAADVNFALSTQTFKEGEEEFALAFAATPEDEGIKFVLQNTGYQAKFREGGEFELGNPKYGDRITCTVIFDNVFIPWERVFLFEDLKGVRNALATFATSHRCVGAACKAGFIDAMTGAASLMLKANGLERVPVLRQRLGEMVGVAEATYAISVGAATKGREDHGVWQPNTLTANAGKVVGVEGFNRVLMNLADIAGGIPVTAPSEFDLKNPEVGKIAKGKVCLIGDSAGMTKPYTGGGLYYHLIAAEILGESFPDLELYKERYLEKMGKEYALGNKILKLYTILSDSDYNDLVRIAKDINFSELEMDYPTFILRILPGLIKKAILKPGLYAKLVRWLV